MKKTPLLILPLAMLLCACTSTTTEKEKYTHFLNNYDDITQSKTASGADVLTWRKPGVKLSTYTHLVYQPLIYFPRPVPSATISQDTLNNILSYTNTKMRDAMASHFTLVNTPQPNTLIFRGAITAVDTEKQGLQFYEVLPVTLLVAATQNVTGHRTMNSAVYIEGEFLDAATRQPVLKVVRKVTGKELNNESTKLTIRDVSQAIDGVALDIRNYKEQ